MKSRAHLTRFYRSLHNFILQNRIVDIGRVIIVFSPRQRRSNGVIVRQNYAEGGKKMKAKSLAAVVFSGNGLLFHIVRMVGAHKAADILFQG